MTNTYTPPPLSLARLDELAAMRAKAQLCYVEGQWAYFTTCPLEMQWGDDWNDAPYEHNAGSPYEWCEYMAEKGIAPYQIVSIAFVSDLDTPSTWASNSPYSVEDINKGAVAWLYGGKYSKTSVKIFAGTTLDKFMQLIAESGGACFYPANEWDALISLAREALRLRAAAERWDEAQSEWLIDSGGDVVHQYCGACENFKERGHTAACPRIALRAALRGTP